MGTLKKMNLNIPDQKASPLVLVDPNSDTAISHTYSKTFQKKLQYRIEMDTNTPTAHTNVNLSVYLLVKSICSPELINNEISFLFKKKSYFDLNLQEYIKIKKTAIFSWAVNIVSNLSCGQIPMRFRF